MRKTRTFAPVTLISLALLILSVQPVSAGDVKELARFNASAAAIEWQNIAADNDGLRLSVTGPDGHVYVRNFAQGTMPALRLQDVGEGRLADGAYTWELTATPRVSAAVRKQLADARNAGDDALAEQIQRSAGLDHASVQSGGFQVRNGAFVPSDAKEPAQEPATATAKNRSAAATSAGKPAANLVTPGRITTDDQVIADDLIVQGSACVGLDCVNNESFGFDTIRLKENNTRIKFDDTSTGTGFPATDWQLTANDSASGGQNKFSIEDITDSKVPFTVTGNAPTNSIFVDSTGRVGLRTATPVLDLHIATGNTPAHRLEQNSSGGFTAQTWDVAGNEANFFVRDVTGGSRLPFRIRPGAPTSSIDIAASGNVGVGTASPVTKLEVVHDVASAATVRLRNTTASGFPGIEYADNTGTVNLFMGLDTTNHTTRINNVNNTPYLILQESVEKFRMTPAGNIGLNGVTNPTNPIQHSSGAFLSTGGTWTNASSREYKQDISELSSKEAMCALEELNPVKYAYKVDPAERHVGFIAEDVPEIVATPDRKGLSPMDVVAVLTKVVKEQQQTIDSLSHRLEQLEAQNKN
jgi:hypothetical protein